MSQYLDALKKEMFFALIDGDEYKAMQLLAKYEEQWYVRHGMRAKETGENLDECDEMAYTKGGPDPEAELRKSDGCRLQDILQKAKDQWDDGHKDRARITASAAHGYRRK